jgi:hypothetical protein
MASPMPELAPVTTAVPSMIFARREPGAIISSGNMLPAVRADLSFSFHAS